MFSIICHLARAFGPGQLGRRAFLGLLLFILNVPVGWGGAALCAIMAGIDQEHAKTWATGSAVIYGLSWGMLGLGILLAGKPVIAAFKKRIPLAIKAARRLRRNAKKPHCKTARLL